MFCKDVMFITILVTEDVVKELEKQLSTIEEIKGTLKVIRSYPLKSLNFLKNLNRIGGEDRDNQSDGCVSLEEFRGSQCTR